MHDNYTDWTLVSLSLWPTSWLLTASALVAACMFSVVLSYKDVPRRGLLIALRVTMGLVVCGLLFEPALQLRVVRRVEDRIAIIVDQSKSMQRALGANNKSRWAAVQTLLTQSAPQLEKLQYHHSLDWYTLDGPTEPNRLTGASPQGETTDLLAALEAAKGVAADRPLAGLLLISDGADNQQLVTEANGALSASQRARLTALGAPINTIDITASAAYAYRDLTVEDVVADAFGFIHNTFCIDVSLTATGFAADDAALRIPVTLKQENQILSSQEVRLLPDKVVHAIFKIKPDVIGEFIYTVQIPVQSGEASADNNMQQFVVQIVRDKIRVLQVSGRPSWDERFLRQYLKENPNTDLVSFFILRTPNDDISIPESELSLIPFPVNKLFTTELKNFDVIIFQNFDFRPYRMTHYLPNIRDAVQSGLGFVMLGGDASFADGGFLGTAIDDILPVRLADAPLRYGNVAPKLTQAGLHHPVMDMGQGAVNRAELFAALPSFTSVNSIAGLAPGATALAEDAGRGANAASGPLIAAMDAGKGRTLSVATDSLWRWQFAFGANGGISARAYQRFWSNALRWLVRDPENAHIRIVPSKRRYELGDKAQAAITVLNSHYQAAVKTPLQVELRGVGHAHHKTHSVVTDEYGFAHLSFDALPAGAYRLQASAPLGDLGHVAGSSVFVMDQTTAETRDATPRPKLLQSLADATHAHVLAAEPEAFSRLQLREPQVVQVDRRRNIELWDNAWAMGALLILFTADWALRRRRGFF